MSKGMETLLVRVPESRYLLIIGNGKLQHGCLNRDRCDTTNEWFQAPAVT